jgi:hypothetical protein
MIQPSAPEHSTSLLMVEGALTAIAIALAFVWPGLGSKSFAHAERLFKQLARKKGLSVAVVAAAAFLLRLAILPLCPAPYPFIPNDFSFLLAANTFASGRLTNPTPAMWMHFESIHITMQPTYMSMYFPAQGLVLAAGKLLTGHAWFGVLCSSALMCAALCWMLQAWLPPGWALLGGIIAILRLGLFSYWINTYSGGGSIAALGGALVLGALPRIMRGVRLQDGMFRNGMLMAVGTVLLATSRPYEGLLLCLPVAFVLGQWILSGENTPPAAALFRLAALPLLVIVAGAAWMGYYDYRAFGNPLTPPYKIDRATYAMAPYFVWQHARPAPVYHNQVMRQFYSHDELMDFQKIHSLSGFVPQTLVKALRGILFFAGILLLPPLIMLKRVLMDRRARFFVICTLVLMAGMLVEAFLVPHYLAPFTAVFYALGLQAMRHLRLWKPGNKPVGLALVRLTVVLCFALTGLRLYAQPLHLEAPEWPVSEWTGYWYGPGHFGGTRAAIESQLTHLPGKQLVIVRYSPAHNPVDEWVYNAPDIDHSKVIWARDMGSDENLQLIHYYKNRTVWLVQPDTKPVELTPYPLPTSAQPQS